VHRPARGSNGARRAPRRGHISRSGTSDRTVFPTRKSPLRGAGMFATVQTLNQIHGVIHEKP
jgi:hypothetical protein